MCTYCVRLEQWRNIMGKWLQFDLVQTTTCCQLHLCLWIYVYTFTWAQVLKMIQIPSRDIRLFLWLFLNCESCRPKTHKRLKERFLNHESCSSPSPRRQWRTGKNGGNWLQTPLWCPNNPRGYRIGCTYCTVTVMMMIFFPRQLSSSHPHEIYLQVLTVQVSAK